MYPLFHIEGCFDPPCAQLNVIGETITCKEHLNTQWQTGYRWSYPLGFIFSKATDMSCGGHILSLNFPPEGYGSIPYIRVVRPRQTTFLLFNQRLLASSKAPRLTAFQAGVYLDGEHYESAAGLTARVEISLSDGREDFTSFSRKLTGVDADEIVELYLWYTEQTSRSLFVPNVRPEAFRPYLQHKYLETMKLMDPILTAGEKRMNDLWKGKDPFASLKRIDPREIRTYDRVKN